MSKKNLVSIAAALMLSVCFVGMSFAQEITASIVGTVKDNNGSSVAGATVVLSDPSKGNATVRTVTTDGAGAFSIPNVQVSTYRMTVEAPNFKKSVTDGIKVDVGARRTVDIQLEAGRIDETVTVNADSVGVELSTPTTGTTINGDQVRELSLNNRNWVQLIAIAPGVSNDLSDQVYTGTTNPDGQANTINISVNGGRSSQNTYTVDGADVTDRGSNITIQAYPSLDSIGEFRVLRSLYPAESGRSGGGQVNIVTRSGSSKFHGSAYEFVRNDAFNANNFLVNTLASPPFGRNSDGKARRAPFRYNDYGWTLSGPVYFLKFGERDPEDGHFGRWSKTFFFFSQEFRKDRRFSAASTVNVPTADMRNGVFPIDVCIARVWVPAENCTVGNPGRLPAGTPIPAAMYSQAAFAYLNGIYKQLPLPNAATATNPFGMITSIRNVSDFQQEIIKVDHSFSSKLSGYYRYERDQIPTIDGNSLFSSGGGLPGVSTTSTNSPGRTHTVQLTYVVSPNVIIDGRYTFGYGAILSKNIGLLALANTQVPITLPFVNQRDRVPSISGLGLANLTSFGPYNNFSWKGNASGSVTWVTGDHIMKFGATYSKYRKNENALAGSNEGLFSSWSATLASGVTSSTANQTYQRWANFLVGNVPANGFSQASFDYTADLRQMAFEGFAQDEWKFRKNMTFYIGARYSFFGSPWDKNGRLSNFVPSLWSAANAPQVTGAGVRVLNVTGVANGNWCNGVIVNSQNYQVGAGGIPCQPTQSPYGKFVMDVSKKDIAPRVGIAWDPFGKGMTSIRAGYGIYHEQVLNGTFLQNIGLNPPYQVTAVNPTATSLDSPAFGLSATTTVQSLRAVQSNWETPYMQHWSLDFQQQLGKSTMFTVGYFGSKGTNLIGLTEMNDIVPGKALNTMCARGTAYYGQSPAPTLVPCQNPGYVFRNTSSAPENPNGTTTDILILDQIRPFKGFRSIAMVQPRYGSNYHSLQVSAQKRFSGASQVNLAYTWSKNLTNNASDRSNSPQDPYNIDAEWGRATLDRRHILNVNFVYELPFFRKQKGVAGKFLGGWQMSGIVSYMTGLPFTITTSNFDPAGTGLINANPAARPITLCDVNSGGAGTWQQYINTACIQRNPTNTENTRLLGLWPNQMGNTPRSSVNGPGTRRVDLTLAKNIRFGERFAVQLRAESFNIFNWVNFRSFSSLNNTSTLFGRISAVRDPRTMQFGVKVSF
ncbi:MAG: carboxypeptidase regulatory-like domain-containing protein [Chloracidobacterium sp.]|nr:carboxypeptidase regulatory-like domain-containing protein [Chloracidobacterium sp.]MCC6824871.1 carboxypeptidase regulatory-like domain-containing protein [Acidobacteriota bacterium]MCO5333543.1 Plug and carboxypeptidase regulatory-like domain-containing protein [Pyrinomonadaceae bacterium]